jgi:NMD protein affecting ribosome stability and mRNA decay
MKCIQCGEQVSQPKTVLCSDCFGSKHTCFKGYEEHTLLICTMCKAHKYKKKWNAESRDAIKDAVLHHCSFIHEPKKTKITLELKNTDSKRKKGTAILETETIIDGYTIKEEFVLPVKTTTTLCDNCARTRTEYFEGILQLRGENEATLKRAHAFIVKETARRNKNGIFINKEIELKNGFDFYYTRQRYIPIIGQELQEKFGATMSTAAQLFTRVKGKDLYRVNAIIRLPAYGLGSIVRYDKKIMKIEKIGRITKGRDITTNKLITINPKEAEVLASPKDFVSAQITKHYPHLEVLHPETYQSTTVMNPKKISKSEKETSIVLIEDDMWLV